MVEETVGLNYLTMQQREWLGSYQVALSSDSFDSIQAQHRLLKSVRRHVAAKIGSSWTDRATLSTSLSAIDMKMEMKPLNYVANKFGVRSTVNRLIFQPNGREQLTKLLKLFDHQHSTAGAAVVHHFLKQEASYLPTLLGLFSKLHA